MSFLNAIKSLFGPQPPVVGFAPTDADHTAAKAEAQASLPAFWAAFEAHGQFGDFLLKVGLPTPGEGLEHVWVGQIRRTVEAVHGTLENQPVMIAERLRIGDEITFSESQISDWTYRKNDRFFGQFTTRVMLQHPDRSRLPPDLAKDMRASLSDMPTES